MFPVARPGAEARANELVIDFGDPGWISIRFLAKDPGPLMRLGEAEMTFRYTRFLQHEARAGRV